MTLLLVARRNQGIKQLLHGGDVSSKNLFDKLTSFNSFLGMTTVGFKQKIISILNNMGESEDKALGEMKPKGTILFRQGNSEVKECPINYC